MKDIKFKTLVVAKFNATYKYGKRKAKMELINLFDGKKIQVIVYILNPLPGDDVGHDRPHIKFNGKTMTYHDGVIWGDRGANLPVENKELRLLAKDAKFKAYLTKFMRNDLNMLG